MRGESADACYESDIVRRAICLSGKVGIAPMGGVVLTCEQHLPRNIPARFHPLAATSVVPASQLPSSAFDVVTFAINIALSIRTNKSRHWDIHETGSIGVCVVQERAMFRVTGLLLRQIQNILQDFQRPEQVIIVIPSCIHLQVDRRSFEV